MDDKSTRRWRKTVSIVSLILFVAVIGVLTWLFTRVLAPYLRSPDELHAYLRGYGWWGRVVLFGLQFLQVVVALIPGEIVELGAGYAYGAVQGTLICLAGVALSSSLIFLLVKKVGINLVEVFLPREKIDSLHFINSERKLKRTVFLLFLIPGTPKDVLTYFVGLTRLRLSEFLTLTLIARIPSVLSSTVCGQILGAEDYRTAGIVYAVTGAVSVGGYFLYSAILRRRRPPTTENNMTNDADRHR